ncbi:pantoate--beta-alanine ligase [Aliikangiella coralliicola]|uniref:Pantothenate synthetase n=1 Tax=Aliikangiella coralliicola TaxID=2592383 RepID=A0A545UEG4_9GAMM|nr:pantoate--beta-alanine ligase [Aliikangiella coralliicola]TQV87848.1 pantoate--beta-alanine ligase [Aliikangiella coralliicola]
MKLIKQPKDLQREILNLKSKGKTIGFVPTMGNLHQGHLSLIEQAKKTADIVVCSIFVNPMQFGPNEDFDSYPRTLDDDIAKLKTLDTDYLFTPTINDIYPQGKEIHTSVEANRMTDKLCGASRPGHFRGVTTVVNILLNIVQPNFAVFGKKDYQQYQIIRAMVKDLMMPIEIVGAPIEREANGLAMSSRNGYLTTQQKEQASVLRKTILSVADGLQQQQPIAQLKERAIETLTENGFKIDYFEIVRQTDLETASLSDKKLLIAAAAWMGKPRLIDNYEIDLQTS